MFGSWRLDFDIKAVLLLTFVTWKFMRWRLSAFEVELLTWPLVDVSNWYGILLISYIINILPQKNIQNIMIQFVTTCTLMFVSFVGGTQKVHTKIIWFIHTWLCGGLRLIMVIHSCWFRGTTFTACWPVTPSNNQSTTRFGWSCGGFGWTQVAKMGVSRSGIFGLTENSNKRAYKMNRVHCRFQKIHLLEMP